MKINVQKLRGMGFKEENVPPYGRCIVVPEDKFDWDWEPVLDQQGHAIIHAPVGDEKMVLVRLTNKDDSNHETEKEHTAPTEPTEAASTSSTSKSLRERMLERQWGEKEDIYLLALVTEFKKVHKRLDYDGIISSMKAEFPSFDRSRQSVYCRVHGLLKKPKKPKREKKLPPLPPGMPGMPLGRPPIGPSEHLESKPYEVLFENYGYQVIMTVEGDKRVYMIRGAFRKLSLPELGAFATEMLFHTLAELGRK
jgi:hypothetical protein